MSIKERVEAGAAFLDFIYGDEWRKKIDLDGLDMGFTDRCVLGQTNTGYESHASDLLLDDTDTYQFGFNAYDCPIYQRQRDSSQKYRVLTRTWKHYLSK